MKKNVLIVVPSYSSGGGAEKILSNILNNINFNKYTIDLVELHRGDKKLEKLPYGVKIKKYYTSYKYGNFINLFLNQLGKRLPKLLRLYLIGNKMYDVELFFEIMYPDFPFSKKSSKKIQWVHGSIEDFSKSKYFWRKKNYLKHFGDANNIVAISNKTENSIKELYPQYKDKIKKIYNGYNFEDILEKSNESIPIKIHEKSICSVGRIEEKKGSTDVLRVLKELHDRGYKYHLYYIGSGDLQSHLEEETRKLELSEYVSFLGYKSNPYKYIKRMKCLISMSKQEGFPGVYVEAMSLGVPFVSTDVGGAYELSYNSRFGDIIYNVSEAASSIIDLVEGEKIVNKEEMFNFIKNFALDKQVIKFEHLIDEERIDL